MQRRTTAQAGELKEVSGLRLGHTLGKGSFGRVRLGTPLGAADGQCAPGELRAVKIIDKSKVTDAAVLSAIEREVEIMKRLNHPCIIRLYEKVETPTHVYLILEHAAGGELFDHIVSQGRMKEPQAAKFMLQILQGVKYCHSVNVVHRDLKPENLLLDGSLNIKITDFGLSAAVASNSFMTTLCGSPNYAAPEILAEKPYGKEVDIWSVGVILFALVVGRLPFQHQNHHILYEKIKAADYWCPKYLSEDVIGLLGRLLVPEPSKRATLDEIFEHKWFKTHAVRRGQPVANPGSSILDDLAEAREAKRKESSDKKRAARKAAAARAAAATATAAAAATATAAAARLESAATASSSSSNQQSLDLAIAEIGEWKPTPANGGKRTAHDSTGSSPVSSRPRRAIADAAVMSSSRDGAGSTGGSAEVGALSAANLAARNAAKSSAASSSTAPAADAVLAEAAKRVEQIRDADRGRDERLPTITEDDDEGEEGPDVGLNSSGRSSRLVTRLRTLTADAESYNSPTSMSQDSSGSATPLVFAQDSNNPSKANSVVGSSALTVLLSSQQASRATSRRSTIDAVLDMESDDDADMDKDETASPAALHSPRATRKARVPMVVLTPESVAATSSRASSMAFDADELAMTVQSDPAHVRTPIQVVRPKHSDDGSSPANSVSSASGFFPHSPSSNRGPSPTFGRRFAGAGIDPMDLDRPRAASCAGDYRDDRSELSEGSMDGDVFGFEEAASSASSGRSFSSRRMSRDRLSNAMREYGRTDDLGPAPGHAGKIGRLSASSGASGASTPPLASPVRVLPGIPGHEGPRRLGRSSTADSNASQPSSPSMLSASPAHSAVSDLSSEFANLDAFGTPPKMRQPFDAYGRKRKGRTGVRRNTAMHALPRTMRSRERRASIVEQQPRARNLQTMYTPSRKVDQVHMGHVLMDALISHAIHFDEEPGAEPVFNCEYGDLEFDITIVAKHGLRDVYSYAVRRILGDPFQMRELIAALEQFLREKLDT